MPAGDKTGPMGQGPRSGRGRGLCSGNSAPGYTDDKARRRAGRTSPESENSFESGKGRRRGNGLGRGRR